MTGETSKTNEALNSQALTEEQAQFLADCERDFKDRYTDTDAEFMEVKEGGELTPPVLDPWYNKPRRNFNWTEQRNRDGRNDRHRNNQDGGGYRQHRQNQERHYHDRQNQQQRSSQSHGDRYYHY